MPSLVALTVCADGLDAPLSPFFGLAPWVMVMNPRDEAVQWLRNAESSAAYMIELICGQAPALAICGHIPDQAALALVDAGIELRIGPCSVPARSLIPLAATLPTPTLAPIRMKSRPRNV
jgi:predicted Fe-Mo cluster-binding NifX family protein